MKQQTSRIAHAQKGAVLVISLIILLVMTLVSITSISVTNLEERMVGNLQDKNLSFQQSENALRLGEMALTDFLTTGSGTITFYSPTSCTPNCWTAANDSSNTSVEWKQDKFFIVENLGKAPLDANCGLILPPTAGCYVDVYRVTGRGTGQSADASTMTLVQSTIKFIQ